MSVQPVIIIVHVRIYSYILKNMIVSVVGVHFIASITQEDDFLLENIKLSIWQKQGQPHIWNGHRNQLSDIYMHDLCTIVIYIDTLRMTGDEYVVCLILRPVTKMFVVVNAD